MDLTCTAHIAATTNLTTGTVSVKFCHLHLGHETDIGRLRLTSSLRFEVAALLHQGVTVSKVMDNLRSRIGDTVQRDSLLCR